MFFFFYKFLFFSWMCLMGTFKKTEYSLICKGSTEIFFIAEFHIPQV